MTTPSSQKKPEQKRQNESSIQQQRSPEEERAPLTAAVITRVQPIEAPYLNEFVHWYVRVLGFSAVYAVNTEPKKAEEILGHVDPALAGSFRLIPLPGGDTSKQNNVDAYMAGVIREHVRREEFVLHIDSDELLFVPPRFCENDDSDSNDSVIQRFLRRHAASFDKFVFHWMTIACDRMYCGSMTQLLRDGDSYSTARLNGSRKAMARTDQVVRVFHHDIELRNRRNTARVQKLVPRADVSEAPCVFHFITRSRSHTLLKTLHQRMTNCKSDKSKREDVRRFLLAHENAPPVNEYPPRLLIHMHEVIYGARENVWNCSNFAELVPECPYKYSEEGLASEFAKVLREEVGIPQERLEEALRKFRAFTEPQVISRFTEKEHDKYLNPIAAVTQKFRRDDRRRRGA